MDNPIKIDLAELAGLSVATRSAIAEPLVSQLRLNYPAVMLLGTFFAQPARHVHLSRAGRAALQSAAAIAVVISNQVGAGLVTRARACTYTRAQMRGLDHGGGGVGLGQPLEADHLVAVQ